MASRAISLRDYLAAREARQSEGFLLSCWWLLSQTSAACAIRSSGEAQADPTCGVFRARHEPSLFEKKGQPFCSRFSGCGLAYGAGPIRRSAPSSSSVSR